MSHKKYSSFIYKGKTLKEWADINGINMSAIRRRLSQGWTVEKAITEPPYNNEQKRFIK